MSHLARTERAALADTLLRVGPDAPTLCEGWQARDLAAHLVVREHQPLSATGIWFGPLAGRTERAQAELIAQPWDTLVAQVRARPAWWHPARIGGPVEGVFDDGEFYIHHEDVRRGDGQPRPRQLDPADEERLWRLVGGLGRLAFRRLGFGVRVEAPGRGGRDLQRKGGRTLIVRGAPGELALVTFGRGRAADVEYDGSEADAQALLAARIGM